MTAAAGRAPLTTPPVSPNMDVDGQVATKSGARKVSVFLLVDGP